MTTMLSRSSLRVISCAAARQGALGIGAGAHQPHRLPRRFIRVLPAKKPHLPDSNFLMGKHDYKDKSIGELLRAAVVFTMCGSDMLVDNSEALLRTSYVRAAGDAGACRRADGCHSACWARV